MKDLSGAKIPALLCFFKAGRPSFSPRNASGLKYQQRRRWSLSPYSITISYLFLILLSLSPYFSHMTPSISLDFLLKWAQRQWHAVYFILLWGGRGGPTKWPVNTHKSCLIFSVLKPPVSPDKKYKGLQGWSESPKRDIVRKCSIKGRKKGYLF